MGSVNMAMELLNGNPEGVHGAAPQGTSESRKGPRGGNLDDPRFHPENRNRALDAPVIESGGERIIGLHDPRAQDTTRAGIEREQPWHRMAAHMLNRGFTNMEVADAAGKSKEQVSILRAQRWFNELCAELAESKEKVIRARLDSYALESVEAIHEIAVNEECDSDGKPLVSARVRLAAHTTLLEHSQGRPTQKVLSVSATTQFSSEREEYASVLEELKSLSLIANQPSQ